jgi:hypothetical protein
MLIYDRSGYVRLGQDRSSLVRLCQFTSGSFMLFHVMSR